MPACTLSADGMTGRTGIHPQSSSTWYRLNNTDVYGPADFALTATAGVVALSLGVVHERFTSRFGLGVLPYEFTLRRSSGSLARVAEVASGYSLYMEFSLLRVSAFEAYVGYSLLYGLWRPTGTSDVTAMALLPGVAVHVARNLSWRTAYRYWQLDRDHVSDSDVSYVFRGFVTGLAVGY